MTILVTSKLVKVYGGQKGGRSVYALNGVDIQVEKGEFLGIMGPSGSGKTTLVNLLGSIDKPTSGNISIDGEKVESLSNEKLALFRRRQLGIIFQDFNLVDSLTVGENSMLPLILDKEKPEVMESKSEEVLTFLDIYDLKDEYPYNLSGGQQQRAAAARALITNPSIILADEPTGNLDSKSSKTLMASFLKMNEDRDATILLITHDPLAASYCNRIIFLQDGRVSMEIRKKENNKTFFNRILDCMAVLEGSES